MVSNSIVKNLIKKYKIDTSVLPEEIVKYAIETELEHKDLIGNSPENALLIAIAHFKESPRYYNKLYTLEKTEEKYWKKHAKPSIFL